ncbi:hypothetical protein FBUS_07359 [Fasciolopsis buskii]|uniref:Uncharacterized protein n=1 Tax=Fasciolopsis buskii TaxID=27845 RepID=A0A8E0RWF5_9TREM|nr:hypothetical protein FBUS_07359 [Fasciolopsis buski]
MSADTIRRSNLVKIRANLTELVSLIEDACRASEHANRRQFLDQLARAFQDVIVDLYETDDLGKSNVSRFSSLYVFYYPVPHSCLLLIPFQTEDRIEDFSTILRAQAEFMRALMARVYEE